MLSLRLNHLLNVLPESKHYWDLCCDHAQLAIAIAHTKNNCRVTALDIVPHIIEQLKNNLQTTYPQIDTNIFQVGSCELEVMTSDAASAKYPHNSTLIMAGVGSDSIIRFLDNIQNVEQLNFVFSSHKNVRRLREYLINHTGLLVSSESVVFDDGHYYEVICCNSQNGDKPTIFGGNKMWNGDEVAQSYFEFRQRNILKIPYNYRDLDEVKFFKLL